MDARWNKFLPVGVAALVLGLIVGVAVVTSGGEAKGPAELKKLSIGVASGGAQAETAAAGDAAPRDSKYAYGPAEYRLTKPLPTDLPTEGPVYSLGTGAASVDEVTRLARALGITGVPTRQGQSWQVHDTKWQLTVQDGTGLAWYYSPYYHCEPTPGGPVPPPDTPVASGGAEPAKPTSDPNPSSDPEAEARRAEEAKSSQTCTGGGVATSSSPAYACPEPACPPDSSCTPAPCPEPTPPTLPAESAARAKADEVFAAAQVPSPKVTANRGWDTWDFVANPVVGGLDTWGWGTYVSVDADLKLRYANGWLAGAEHFEDYPVRKAQEAFDELKDQPHAMPAIACDTDTRDSATPECANFEPRTVDVTGVRLGLIFGPPLDGAQGEAYLVPAWIFETSDGDLPVIALPAEYIEAPPTPEPMPMDPGTEPGDGPDAPPPPASTVKPDQGSGGGTSGSTGQASAAPADSAGQPEPARS